MDIRVPGNGRRRSDAARSGAAPAWSRLVSIFMLACSQEHRPGRIGQPDESGGSRESFTWVMRRGLRGRSSGWRMQAARRVWQVDFL